MQVLTIAAGVVLGILAYKLLEAFCGFLGVAFSIARENIQDRPKRNNWLTRFMGPIWVPKVVVGLVLIGMVWLMFHAPYSVAGK